MGEVLATLRHAGTPLTANQEKRSKTEFQRREHRVICNEWRTAFGWLGRQYRSTIECFPVGVEAAIVQPPSGRADTAGHYPIVKAALDGLTDAGVWPDDGPRYVAWHTYYAPLRHASVIPGTVELRLRIVSLDDGWLLLHGSVTSG